MKKLIIWVACIYAFGLLAATLLSEFARHLQVQARLP